VAGEDGKHGQPGDGDVHGDDVGDGLADVVEDAAAHPDRLHDRGEIVVEQHEGRGFAGDASVPRLPMAIPICAAFSAGASFTPSPVMATISPLAFQRPHDPQFLLGYGAGEDAHVPDAAGEVLVAHRVELGAGDAAVRRP